MRRGGVAKQGVEAIRDAFDRTFAEPERADPPPRKAYLSLTAAGRSLHLPAHAAAGVMARVPVTPLPSDDPHLLGLAQIRGWVVPVYALDSLLGGQSRALVNNIATWAAVVQRDASHVALVCMEPGTMSWFEEHEVTPDSLLNPADLPISML